MNRTKPYCGEVILAELMAASFPLTGGYLLNRCTREAGNPRDMVRELHQLGEAGLIECTMIGFRMTDEGRAQLQARPPYDCYRAIRDELRASGPLSFNDLRHACHRQACDYSPEQFTNALYALVRGGYVIDASEPTDTESTYEWIA